MIATTSPVAEMSQPVSTAVQGFLRSAKPNRLRTMREFYEQEIVIPTGPSAGRRFRVSRQPFMGLWLDAMDSGQWTYSVCTGPSQSGKTLGTFVGPILYHLFETNDTVVVGLPDMDMAADKWERDILPAIEKTSYRGLLPRVGRGSRGGKFDTIHFRHGPSLKFMSGGGSDKSRSHFTARIVVFTEVDELGVRHSTSVESDKIKQIEARTLRYGDRRRIYKECTVSVPEGHIWRNYQEGTASRILTKCPHCGRYVSLEREHLIGWKGVDNELLAESALFFCSECGESWSEQDRIKANRDSILIHRGQELEGNQIKGEIPATRTLGFRWSAVNNLFLSSAFLGAAEWHGSRAFDEDNAERELHQFYWCIPYEAQNVETTTLDFNRTKRKTAKWAKGLIPDGTEYVTCGVDIGKRLLHWTAIAWFEGGQGCHVFDYGRIDVASDNMPIERALIISLSDLRDAFETGWTTTDGKQRPPDQTWIDAGWQTNIVYEFIRNSPANFYRPCVGRGVGQQRMQWYNRPKRTGSTVKHLGDGFHFSWIPGAKVHLVEVNADTWKSRLHQMLNLPPDKRGSMTLYSATANEHTSWVKHQMAEHQIEEFIPGKGMVKRWEKVHANNHWGDSTYIASAAASFCGFALWLDQSARPDESGSELHVSKLQRIDGP